MTETPYRIIFAGEIQEHVAVAAAKQNLKKLLNANDETIQTLFSGKPLVLKKGLSKEQLDKYVQTLEKAGLIVTVEPPIAEPSLSLDLEPLHESNAGSPSPQSKPQATEIQDGNPYEAPNNTGLQKKVHCRECGAKLELKATLCHRCGAKQIVGKSRSKITAGILAILFGFFGAHRFYLGQWWGLIYWFFSVISWPIAIIEGIVFLLTPQARWEEKYGNVTGVGRGVAIAITLLGGIMLTGIIAAVAIPAYQDYLARTQITQAMPKIEETKQKMENFIQRVNFIPNSNLDAGLPEKISGPYISSIRINDNGKMLVTFSSPENTPIDGQTIQWVPTLSNKVITWDCSGGSMPKKYRPPECHEGAFVSDQAPSNMQSIHANDGTVALQLPASWEAIDELTEEGVLEYGNIYSEAYVVVLWDAKQDLPGFTLTDFTKTIIDNNFANLSNSDIEFLGATITNGHPSRQFKISGTVDGVSIIYRLALIEGPERFYQVLTWSLKSRYEGNLEDLEYVISSFQIP
ncbi:MAG: pilin [Pseudomonadales bacterium]|nr:pilin [Pseudomonadales bacterium]